MLCPQAMVAEGQCAVSPGHGRRGTVCCVPRAWSQRDSVLCPQAMVAEGQLTKDEATKVHLGGQVGSGKFR